MRPYRGTGYKRPRTRQESAYSLDEDHAPYIRAKRRKVNLPTVYDDRQQTHCSKSRKLKSGFRGKKHCVAVYEDSYYTAAWKFEEYCKKNSIPYRFEEIYERRTRSVPIYKKVFVGNWEQLDYSSHTKKNGKRQPLKTKLEPHYEKVKIGEKTVNWKYVIGSRFIWWSNKDIGISFLLKGVNYVHEC